MRRITLFAVVALAATIIPAASTPRTQAGPARGLPTIRELGARADGAYRLDPIPSTLGPEERADYVLHYPIAGRTPSDWLAWSRETFRLDARARSLPAATLTEDVLRIYRAVGLPIDPTLRATLDASAAALPADIVAPFAGVTHVVADAYDAQVPIARAVNERFARGEVAPEDLLTGTERDAMAARQARILRALNAFRARTAASFMSIPGLKAADPPLFSDPEGLVVLGGTGNGTYTRGGMIADPVLLIDPAGNDKYFNSAGGACPLTIEAGGRWMDCNMLAVSVVADLGDDTTSSSDDLYRYDGAPSAIQGAGGPGGLGMLIDVGGDDRYEATMTRGATAPFEPITYYFDGGAQGFGYGGDGLLLDGAGNDTYDFAVNSTKGQSIWGLGQGFGGAGGLGIASDGTGDDQWLTEGLGLTGSGFEGIYTNGTGFYGGVGIQTDTGLGDDVYHSTVTAQTVDYYALGFGAFGGLGLLYDDGGNEDYYTYEEGLSPWINPLLNCAYGTASFGAIGIHIDAGGDDDYYGATKSSKQALVMDWGGGGPSVAYGLFMDLGGNDAYIMEAFGTKKFYGGRGYWETGLGGDILNNPVGENTFGTFVDIGGTDVYKNGHGANNDVWPFGIDRSA